jgi:AraC family transcriptional regulator, regulatory protein of adaptative response / methylated-DNA-[protein]-cysteine methyltransferase
MIQDHPMTTLLDINLEDTYWQAVQSRDSQFNGVFVYGVRSTGIYCRPGCPSRRPRREQVTFFASPAAAGEAGFRACRRCRPQEALTPNQQAELASRVCRLIEATFGERPPSLAELGSELHLSPSHLQRIFKAVTGLTPHQYARGQRMQRFKSQVRQGQDVTTALYEAGFGSSSRLYEQSDQRLGMTPAEYRRGGQGMQIGYTIVDTPLGRMLVAAAERGICAVSFEGEDGDAGLESRLSGEYPAARIRRDDEGMGMWAAALVAHLEGKQPDLALPLDLQATAFQLRVWEELRRIPYGQTRSYAQVAQAIGKPAAVRAVAQACAANPAVLVTPCHRVVRSDGGLGGYRYGLRRKQALLNREKGR